MKGRGVRVIDDTDFQAVTPDADGEGPVRHRRRRRRHRERARRHRPARPQADRPAREAAHAGLLRRPRPRRRSPRSPPASRGSTGGSARTSATSSRQLAGGTTPQGDRGRDRRRARPRPAARRRPRGDRQRTSPTSTTSPPPPGRSLDEAVAPLATSPELRERIVEVRRAARAGDRRDLRRRGDRGRLLRRRHRPRPRTPSSPGSSSARSNRDEITALQILRAADRGVEPLKFLGKCGHPSNGGYSPRVRCRRENSRSLPLPWFIRASVGEAASPARQSCSKPRWGGRLDSR